jgi:uncharacterized membrane protein
MDALSKKKISYLMTRIAKTENKMTNIMKECAMSNDETLLFWTGKEKELKEQYMIIKALYAMVLKYVINKEYWYKTRQQRNRINHLKSVDINVSPEYKKKLIHTRTLQNRFKSAYDAFTTALDAGYKKKVRLLTNIQQAIIKVNRLDTSRGA